MGKFYTKTVEYLRTSGNNINSDSCQIISQLLPELSLKLDLMIFTRGGKKIKLKDECFGNRLNCT